MKLVPPVSLDDKVALRRHLQKLASKLGPEAVPTFAELTLTGLTASTLVGANASKLLESVTIGTGLDYTRPTLSLSHLGIEALTDPGADRIMFWDDNTTAAGWLAVGNSIAITTTTIDTIQDIRTSASPQFTGIELGHATDTTITRASAGNLNIEGNLIYRAGGTDVPIADGGTGASSASAARTNLGLVIGTDTQAWDAGLDSLAALTYASDSFIKVTAENTYAIRTIAETKTDLSLNLVENTALSTWAGSANITTLGTIATVGNITIADGGTIGQAAGPLLEFDNTNDYLEITGCKVGIGTPAPTHELSTYGIIASHVGTASETHERFRLARATTPTIRYHSIFGTNGSPGDNNITFKVHDGSGTPFTNQVDVLILQGDGSVVLPNGPLFIKEQAAADADTAAYGQIWVKTVTPNELWFTNDAGTDLRIAPQDLQITASPQFVKIGLGISPNNRVHIQTIATEGMAGLFINQVDDDQPFIEYYGNSAADTTRPITSLTAGNSIQGFVRTHINGTDYWMPYYDAPTS